MIASLWEDFLESLSGAGDIAQLIEHLPGMHPALGSITSLNLDMKPPFCNLSTQRRMQKDQKLKVILSHRARLLGFYETRSFEGNVTKCHSLVYTAKYKNKSINKP